MGRLERQEHPLLRAGIVLAMVAVFAAELVTPLGIAEWVFYLVPVALSLFLWRPWAPLLVAAVATLLMAAGAFVTPQVAGFPVGIARLNRAFGVVALWGLAVIAMRFIRSRLELRMRDWLRRGQGEVAAVLQGEIDLDDVARDAVRVLCTYLDAPVGALWVVDADGRYRRLGGVALAEGTGGPDGVAVGEGLVGQAVRDRRILRLDDVPLDRLPVLSGLGAMAPRHLVVAPLTADRDVTGVVELGFFHAVEPTDLELLAAVAEPIGVAIRSVHYRRRLEELLAETQQQAERLQVQQEELRVVNEELEEQGRALRDSQARLEAQHAELEQTNVQLEEQTQALERQRDALARAQTDLLEKADELGRASQYKSEFLANMSHELRTPLNSALILSRMLADNKTGTLTPEQVQWAESIYSAGNDLLMLINDILDLSRIEAGRMELSPDTLDVGALTEMLRRTFTPLARERRLELAIAVAPDTPRRRSSRIRCGSSRSCAISSATRSSSRRRAAYRSTSRRAPAGRSRSSCATRASASRRSCTRASSRRSGRCRAAIVRRAARGSGSRSRASWRAVSAATSTSKARPARAARSRSSCQSASRRRSRCVRRRPHRVRRRQR
jgi:signal transduction histidine kinase